MPPNGGSTNKTKSILEEERNGPNGNNETAGLIIIKTRKKAKYKRHARKYRLND